VFWQCPVTQELKFQPYKPFKLQSTLNYTPFTPHKTTVLVSTITWCSCKRMPTRFQARFGSVIYSTDHLFLCRVNKTLSCW